MNADRSLRHLLRELLTALAVFGLIGCVLVVERQGLTLPAAVNDNGLIDEDRWYEVRNERAGEIDSAAPRALVVFDDADRDSGELKDNLCFVLNSLFVHTDCLAVPQKNDQDFRFGHEDERGGEEEEDDADEEAARDMRPAAARAPVSLDLQGYQELILCISDFSCVGTDPGEISRWVRAGGHLLFAVTPDNNENLAPWYELMGIGNTGQVPSAHADSLLFCTELLAGAKGMEFSDDVITSTVLAPLLSGDCLVHLKTANEEALPLLWERQYGSGKVIVCNADIMESKADRGIAASAYCRFYPAFVYPVINAAVYCIDDCPSPAPAGYEKNVLSQYGYTVSDFLSNVWMPAIQRLAEKYQLRFSTFLIQTYENDVDGPFTNFNDRESASYYANLILNAGGEIGLHGYNHQPLVFSGYQLDEENSGYVPWNSIRDMIESLRAAIEYGEGLADDLVVASYVAPSNVISPEALQEMLVQLEDIRVYAGVYLGTPDQFIQEYSVLENGAVFCPRLTADMQMEDSEWWVQINELNFQYIESNFIHPDDLMDEDRSDGGDFRQMLNGYQEMIEWNRRQGLRVATISEAGGAVQRYANLSVRQELDDHKLTVHTSGLIDEAYLMLRTDGMRLAGISEGAYTQLSEDVYILRVVSETTVLTLVDRV